MPGYFVYILECADKSYYTGITNNIYIRIQQHQSGYDPKAYTFNRRPLKLVWHVEFSDPASAISLEKKIKSWSRQKKQALISGTYEQLVVLSKKKF